MIRMDTSVETHKALLKKIIHTTQLVNFVQDSPERGISISFFRRIRAYAQDILKLGKDSFCSCVLSCQMVEGIILLIWLLEKKERIRRYTQYGIVEKLSGLQLYPQEKDELLKFIKEKNVSELLNQKIKRDQISDEILLSPNNYYNNWYKPEANGIADIVKKLTENNKHTEIKNIYDMYRRLCAYKHYSPYAILPRYGSNTPFPTEDKSLAFIISLQCLFIALMLVNQHQPNPLDINDIIKEYYSLFSIGR